MPRSLLRHVIGEQAQRQLAARLVADTSVARQAGFTRALCLSAILRAGANPERKEMKMEVTRIGSQPSSKGPTDWFTGTVRIDPLFSAEPPARVAGASVTFEPGARTAWHTHPAGQTLIVVSGMGWVQREGGPVEEVHPGDVVWFSPDEKHWHGASPAKAMSHIAIHEELNGEVVTWLEKVSDSDYSK